MCPAGLAGAAARDAVTAASRPAGESTEGMRRWFNGAQLRISGTEQPEARIAMHPDALEKTELLSAQFGVLHGNALPSPSEIAVLAL